MGKIDTPKIAKNRLLEKTFQYLDLRISKFIHTLSESKSILQLNKRLLFHALKKMLRFYWDTRYT